MKESSGELSMTVITIIAVIAIGGIITTFALPTVRTWIQNTFNTVTGTSTICPGNTTYNTTTGSCQ